jgi:DnaJ-class molecular chaperone
LAKSSNDKVKCPNCGGKGMVTVNNITGRREKCPNCGGKGVV